MFIATMETESYTWMSLGETEEQVKQAILDRWNKRQLQAKQSMKDLLGFEPTFYKTVEEMENDYSILCKDIEPGQCEIW